MLSPRALPDRCLSACCTAARKANERLRLVTAHHSTSRPGFRLCLDGISLRELLQAVLTGGTVRRSVIVSVKPLLSLSFALSRNSA